MKRLVLLSIVVTGVLLGYSAEFLSAQSLYSRTSAGISPTGHISGIDRPVEELIFKIRDTTITDALNTDFEHDVLLDSQYLQIKYFPNNLKNYFTAYVSEIRPAFPNFRQTKEKIRRIQNGNWSSFNLKEKHIFQRLKRAPQRARPQDVQLDQIFTVKIKPGQSIDQAMLACSSNPAFEYCQTNDPIQFSGLTPLHPESNQYFNTQGTWGQVFDDLWGLKKIQAPQAWSLGTGEYINADDVPESVIVAVDDTGVDYNHPDIRDNIWINPEVISDWNNDGQINLDDTDTNGNRRLDENEYVPGMFGEVDEVSVPPMDDDGHGSHIAGIIAGVDNNIGIIGVAPRAKVMALKIIGTGDVWTATGMGNLRQAVDNGADIISNSWDTSPVRPRHPALEEVIKYAYDSGVVVVWAAGNSSRDAKVVSPQNMTNAKPIVVSASNVDDSPASFTNYGATVDIYAPGGGSYNQPPAYKPEAGILSIKSEINAYADSEPQLVVDDNYLRVGGTSMAAPMVAGVAALILSAHPDYSNEDVRQIIRASHDSMEFPKVGGGRLNAFKAVSLTQRLKAKITDPHRDSVISMDDRVVEIKGFVEGDHFREYQLSYFDHNSYKPGFPIVWNPIMAPRQTLVPMTPEGQGGVLGSWDISQLKPETYLLRLEATSDDGTVFTDFIDVEIKFVSKFIRGDANFDQAVDLSDAVYILLYLFVASSDTPACLDALDVNDDSQINISDALYILEFLFRNGPPPPSPYPQNGTDPSPDQITCGG